MAGSHAVGAASKGLCEACNKMDGQPRHRLLAMWKLHVYPSWSLLLSWSPYAQSKWKIVAHRFRESALPNPLLVAY